MRPQKSGSRFCLYCQCQCKRPAATAHEGIDSEVSDGIPLPMQCRVLSCTRVICECTVYGSGSMSNTRCVDTTSVSTAGLGLANLAGGAFSAYPTVGGFSRSAVSADSGAKSGSQQLALVFAAPKAVAHWQACTVGDGTLLDIT